VIEISYYGDFEAHHGHGSSGEAVMESPASMLVPLLIVSIGLVVTGLYTGSIVNHLITPILAQHGF
jgi:multicomponent Na+:H+ antiporter subunit D